MILSNLTLSEIQALCSKEKCNIVTAKVIRADGSVGETAISKNARVDAGATAIAQLVGSASSAAFNFVALSITVLTPVKSDVTLTGETTASGLVRKALTYGGYVAPSTLNGVATYTLTGTYTNTSAAAVTASSVGCFNAVTAGTMLAESNLSVAQTLQINDQLAVTWTFTV